MKQKILKNSEFLSINNKKNTKRKMMLKLKRLQQVFFEQEGFSLYLMKIFDFRVNGQLIIK